MMRRFIYLSFFLCLISAWACGQSIFSGRVLENKTHITLRGVIVTNLTNKLRTITTDGGSFSIAAKAGDLIVFKNFSYLPDTLLLTDMHDREVFLTPATTMLDQVTITDTSGRTNVAEKNMKYYDPDFHGQPVVVQRDRNGNPVGGIDIRMHYFTKDDNDKRKAQQLEKDRATREQIGNTFAADNVAKFVPLKGTELDDFILLYTPDIKTYASKDFNLLNYLNDSYKAWLKLSPGQRKAGHLDKG